MQILSKNILLSKHKFLKITIILFIITFNPQLLIFGQNDCSESKPPEKRGNSRIVDSNGGITVSINGEKCEPAGGSGNYNCGTDYISVDINYDTFIVSNGYCEWEIIAGDWSNPKPVDDGALPVDLLRFEAEQCDENVCIYWSTATEFNNDFFILEKSYNLIDFQDVGVIYGNGYSSEQIDYSYIDKSVTKSEVYYRLTQVDFDGSITEYSPIFIEYDIKQAISVNVYPNPVIDYINFDINISDIDEIFKVSIYDNSGHLVLRENLTGIDFSSNHRISFSGYEKGYFIVELTLDGERIYSTRIVNI